MAENTGSPSASASSFTQGLTNMKAKLCRILLFTIIGGSCLSLLLGGYMTAVGLNRRTALQVDEVKQEISREKAYADQLSLPPKQAKAYVSSLNFLGTCIEVVDVDRNMLWRIGAVICALSFWSALSAILVVRDQTYREKRTPVPEALARLDA